MVTFVFDGTQWQVWDEVQYTSQVLTEGQTTLCHAAASSHTDLGSTGLGATMVPASRGFRKVRVALKALERGNKVPVLVVVGTT